jgi:hypothetical protein
LKTDSARSRSPSSIALAEANSLLRRRVAILSNKAITCWWEKPLVVALKHSEGIKHTVLFQEQKAYNNLKSLIHTLSFSLSF